MPSIFVNHNIVMHIGPLLLRLGPILRVGMAHITI